MGNLSPHFFQSIKKGENTLHGFISKNGSFCNHEILYNKYLSETVIIFWERAFIFLVCVVTPRCF